MNESSLYALISCMVELKDKRSAFEFSGHAQQILLERYGDPCAKGWGRKWLTNWKVKNDITWFPTDALCIHKDFQPILYRAFRELESRNVYQEIEEIYDAYCIRNITGSGSVLSVHSWGVALDMNAEKNPLGSAGKWSPEFINAMVNNGVYCGQDWIGRKDPMHFAMVNG